VLRTIFEKIDDDFLQISKGKRDFRKKLMMSDFLQIAKGKRDFRKKLMMTFSGYRKASAIFEKS